MQNKRNIIITLLIILSINGAGLATIAALNKFYPPGYQGAQHYVESRERKDDNNYSLPLFVEFAERALMASKNSVGCEKMGYEQNIKMSTPIVNIYTVSVVSGESSIALSCIKEFGEKFNVFQSEYVKQSINSTKEDYTIYQSQVKSALSKLPDQSNTYQMTVRLADVLNSVTDKVMFTQMAIKNSTTHSITEPFVSPAESKLTLKIISLSFLISIIASGLYFLSWHYRRSINA